jgi:hypothetical protein
MSARSDFSNQHRRLVHPTSAGIRKISHAESQPHK